MAHVVQNSNVQSPDDVATVLVLNQVETESLLFFLNDAFDTDKVRWMHLDGVLNKLLGNQEGNS